MHNEETDICVMIETYLKDQTTLDKLEQMGHKLLPVNTLDRPRGGICLLFNNHLDIMKLDKEHYDSYIYGIWKLKLDSKAITICGIYRPP